MGTAYCQWLSLRWSLGTGRRPVFSRELFDFSSDFGSAAFVFTLLTSKTMDDYPCKNGRRCPNCGNLQKKREKPTQTVYFTHETKKDNQNHADTQGVLRIEMNWKRSLELTMLILTNCVAWLTRKKNPKWRSTAPWVLANSWTVRILPTERCGLAMTTNNILKWTSHYVQKPDREQWRASDHLDLVKRFML